MEPSCSSAAGGERASSEWRTGNRTCFAPEMNSSNRNERDRNRKETNEADRYPAAHNGLVAGSRKQHTSLLSSNGPSTVDNDQ
jgi:hypothetical protein